MLSLNDLKRKPSDNEKVINYKIEEVEISRNFHYGAMTLSIRFRNVSLFGSIHLGDEYLANVLNLVFELFKEEMDSCENLEIRKLSGKHCRVVFDGNYGVAIGHWNEDKWIYVDEVIELLKQDRK